MTIADRLTAEDRRLQEAREGRAELVSKVRRGERVAPSNVTGTISFRVQRN